MPPRRDQASIVIADDDRDVCSVLGMFLARKGHRVVQAFDGTEAWKKIQESKPDLALLDVMMPGITGIEVCRRIRENPALANIPVIIISALNEPDEILTGFKAGANDYITKPFVNAEVIARVSSALRQWRLTRARERHEDLAGFGEHLNRIVTQLERPYRTLLKTTRQIRDQLVSIPEESQAGNAVYQNCMRSYLVLKELQQKRESLEKRLRSSTGE